MGSNRVAKQYVIRVGKTDMTVSGGHNTGKAGQVEIPLKTKGGGKTSTFIKSGVHSIGAQRVRLSVREKNGRTSIYMKKKGKDEWKRVGVKFIGKRIKLPKTASE